MINNEETHIFLIIGASGSGKTTATKELEKMFSPEIASFHYFDDIGIPSFEEMISQHGSSEKWQEWATQVWLDAIAKIQDKKLVVLEGSFYPDPALSYLQKLGLKNYTFICIHTSRQVREERLNLYRKQPELVTEGMENYAQVLRQRTLKLGYSVIDSSNKEIKEIAEELYKLINTILHTIIL